MNLKTKFDINLKNLIDKIGKFDWYLLEEQLYQNPKYKDSKRITHYGKSVFSQNGEDGIIHEIFNRIGTTNKFFCEFGVEDGLECNTTLLLLENWKGLWIEGDNKSYNKALENFDEAINKDLLTIQHSFITPENIEEIFDENNVPKDLDLLSIDIDTTDYWVRKAITNYKPRVLIMEYNAAYFPPVVWIKKKNETFWDGDINMGASLQALHDLNKLKGYTLVGCDFNGVNAFFVRNDCYDESLFESDTSAEHHYEPFKDIKNYVFHRRAFSLGDIDEDILNINDEERK